MFSDFSELVIVVPADSSLPTPAPYVHSLFGAQCGLADRHRP
ncbi:MAG: hypothetical protein ACLR7Z_14195 [Bilophila wadsworthia]